MHYISQYNSEEFDPESVRRWFEEEILSKVVVLFSNSTSSGSFETMGNPDVFEFADNDDPLDDSSSSSKSSSSGEGADSSPVKRLLALGIVTGPKVPTLLSWFSNFSGISKDVAQMAKVATSSLSDDTPLSEVKAGGGKFFSGGLAVMMRLHELAAPVAFVSDLRVIVNFHYVLYKLEGFCFAKTETYSASWASKVITILKSASHPSSHEEGASAYSFLASLRASTLGYLDLIIQMMKTQNLDADHFSEELHS